MSYAELRDSLKDAPKTWLPALLRAAVEGVRDKQVFRDDNAVLNFVTAVLIHPVKHEEYELNGLRTIVREVNENTHTVWIEHPPMRGINQMSLQEWRSAKPIRKEKRGAA